MGCASSSADADAYHLQEAPVFGTDIAGSVVLPVVDATTEAAILKSAALGDFQFRDIVGRGGKSVGVQVAYNAKVEKFYAVKIIDERLAARENWEVQPRDEMAALRTITAAGCNFIVRLEGSYEQDGKMYLVMEFMSGGELTYRLHGRRMSRDEVMLYAAEVLLALKSLHALGYIYRDLKPENILLNEAGHVFLCDLGFAIQKPRCYRKLGCVSHAACSEHPAVPAHSCNLLRVPCSTPQYLAPEIISDDVATEGYTAAVDYWAYGCLLVG
jgi:serine/threonine protein kinase